MKVIVLALLVMSTCGFAQAANDVTGCYRLHLSAWAPAVSHGEDGVFMTPPSSIRLSPKPDRSWDEAGLRVELALGAKPSVHTSQYWLREKGKIRIVWTTGFSGLSMTLGESKDGLRGTAESFWDFERNSQTSDVFAERVSCGSKR